MNSSRTRIRVPLDAIYLFPVVSVVDLLAS